jgi:N4-gp56 family major capsid protein
MSVDGFIPTIWSARLLQALRKAQVFVQSNVVNRDYEGEIAQVGDSVRIGQIGDVTISTYTKNTDIAAPSALTDAQMTLVIDQGKYFNFQVDDIDRAQIKPNLMDEAMARAAYNLKDLQDQYVAGLYTDLQGAVGSSGSPKTDLGTAGKAYEYIVAAAQALDEQNVPSDGRVGVVPPWFYAQLLLDKRFVESSEASHAVALNGQVGSAAGVTILKSNNVSHSTVHYRIPFLHPMAISFAEQINKVEAYRPQLRFADAVKGLLLYGAKVVRSDAGVVLFADQP